MSRLGRGFPVQVRTSRYIGAAAGTWASTDGQITVTATSGSFSTSGAATWSSTGATVTVTATSGAFLQPTTALVPTTVSGRHLLDQNGAPVLIKTLSCWGMVQNLSAANRPGFLDQVVAAGYNSITIAMFGGHYGADWNRYQDAAGNNAFTGTPWASSLGTAWNTLAAIIDDCNTRGMFVNVSLYSGFNSDNGIVDDITAVTAAQARTCGSAVATLLAGKKFIWHLGLDSLTYSKTNLDAFFHGVVDVEGAGARLMWCEPAGSSPGDSANNQGVGDPGNGWVYFIRSMNSRYDYDDQATVDADIVWAQSSEPVIDCEPPYVGAGHYSGTSGAPDANESQELRERKWCDYLRGYIGINDGHEMIWPFGKTGIYTVSGVTYSTALATTPMQQLAYVNPFVDAHCADTTWAPSSSFVTTGVGTGDTKAGVGASDTAAAAYFPTNRTVVVDTTIIAGTGNVRLYWLDPTDGSTSSIATSEAQNASRSVTYPSNHADGTSDFVLVVEVVDRSWTGNGATVLITATSGSFAPAGTATWTGNGATVTVTATSGAFGATGTAAWSSVDGTVLVTATSGAFTPGGAAVWASTDGQVTITATSGSFGSSAGPQTWNGNDATIAVAATSGAFGATGTVGWTSTGGTVLVTASGAAWNGSDGTVTITATSGAFSSGGVTWAGNDATLAITATSGSFVAAGTAAWASSIGTILIAAASGLFASFFTRPDTPPERTRSVSRPSRISNVR